MRRVGRAKGLFPTAAFRCGEGIAGGHGMEDGRARQTPGRKLAKPACVQSGCIEKHITI